MPESRYLELHDAGPLRSIRPGGSPYGPMVALRHFDRRDYHFSSIL